MGFSLEELAAVRPFLYHLTATVNLARIRATRRLESAASLAHRAGAAAAVGTKRPAAVALTVDGYAVSLRDQAPLHAGNVAFHDGWDFERLLAELNARVFFWPGTEEGPISYGVRHFERYRDEDPAVIRVSTSSMLAGAEACKFNSGSPRCSGGLGSPRGSATFHPMLTSELIPSRVVEVTWLDAVQVPPQAWLASTPWGPWEPL